MPGFDPADFEEVAAPAAPGGLDPADFEGKPSVRDVVTGQELKHGPGQTFVRKAMNVLTSGLYDEAAGWVDAAIEHGGLPNDEEYRRSRDKYRALTKQGAEENPKAAIAGTVAGIGVSALTGRPTAGTSLLGTGARGVAQGGLYGLGESEADLTKGEWHQAIEDTIKSGVVGGVAGVAGQKLSNWIRGAPERADRTLLSDIGQRANKGVRDKMAENATETLSAARKLGGYKIAQEAPELLEKASKAQQVAGKRIGEIDKAVQEGFGPVRTAKVVDKLAELEKRFTENGQLSRAKAVQNVADEVITAFGDSAPVGNFRQYISSLGDKAYETLSEKASAKVNKQIYRAVSGALKEHAQDAAKAVPELKPLVKELPKVSSEFGALSDIVLAAKQRARLVPFKPTGLRSFSLRGLAEAAVDKTVGQVTRPTNEKLAALSRLAQGGDRRAAQLLQFMTGAPRAAAPRAGAAALSGVGGLTEAEPADESEPGGGAPAPMVSAR